MLVINTERASYISHALAGSHCVVIGERGGGVETFSDITLSFVFFLHATHNVTRESPLHLVLV